jgi:hypothetical protein
VNRNPSALSLQLIESMSTDPTSTPALRAFHAKQLVRLRAAVKVDLPSRPSPFSRFVEHLEKHDHE